jgi:hypothetical protein
MPIHHTIIYDVDASEENVCAQASALETELFQHAIVKHDGSYVEQVDVTYSPDGAGMFSTAAFQLTMLDLSYQVTPIARTVLTARDNGSTHTVTTDTANDRYVVSFSAPTVTGDVLFEFGTSSTPPTKLKVVIKHKPLPFTCPE